ncbi:MAG: ABC transporter substrate-binding protein [Lachnospiraceae bacterium]|nr:ABC transporter substrate-binding protein [Lachnospiraceae bacterium]
MRSYGKLTKLIINAVALSFILTAFGCSAIKGNETDVEPHNEGVIINEVQASDEALSEETVTTEEAAVSEGEQKEISQRVIALSKSNAELWLLAGGELIATSDDAMKIGGISEETVSLGDMDHVSLEAIAALEPDLLIVFSTDPAQKALGEAAEGIGIKVLYTNIDDFDDYEAVMKDLTAETGRDDLYKKNVEDVAEEIEEIIGSVPEDAKEGTYLLLHVSATKSKVEKNDYFASEIFNNLGLTNIAADDSSFDDLSIEQIVTADPDYIFVVPRGDEKKAMASFDELFTGQAAWESLSAVQNGKYYLLSKDLFGLKPNDKWAETYKAAFELLY